MDDSAVVNNVNGIPGRINAKKSINLTLDFMHICSLPAAFNGQLCKTTGRAELPDFRIKMDNTYLHRLDSCIVVNSVL